jgi:hypothetical protein
MEVKFCATNIDNNLSPRTSIYNKERTIHETDLVPTASAICEVKIEHARLKRIKPMKNLSHHADLIELVTSLLTRGIQMGLTPELGWLIGMHKLAMWINFLYFLQPALTFNSQNPNIIPTYSLTHPAGMLG